jgi:DNA-binding NtrC family response regulator
MSSSIVLIVDDHADTCEVLKITLEMSGYVVFVALDGNTALSLARRHRPRFILMDYLLGGDMGAAQIVPALKSEGISSHIILMSGIGDPSQRAIQLGLKHFIQKPFAAEDLTHLLATVTQQATQPPAGAADGLA